MVSSGTAPALLRRIYFRQHATAAPGYGARRSLARSGPWHRKKISSQSDVAEAILDRVVDQAYHIAMQGESMREVLPSRSTSGITESMTTS